METWFCGIILCCCQRSDDHHLRTTILPHISFYNSKKKLFRQCEPTHDWSRGNLIYPLLVWIYHEKDMDIFQWDIKLSLHTFPLIYNKEGKHFKGETIMVSGFPALLRESQKWKAIKGVQETVGKLSQDTCQRTRFLEFVVFSL